MRTGINIFLYILSVTFMLSCSKKATPQLDSFNYIIGTQSIGAKYQFTDDPVVLETAKQIRQMGSNFLKVKLSVDDRPEEELDKTPREVAQEHPVMKEMLDMDFYYYHLWTYCKDVNWFNGLSDEEKKSEYKQIYDLTAYLLTQYNESNKTFFIGHWEGDWYLVDNYDRTQTNVDSVKIQGMIDWYTTRQKAIDDAKTDTKHSDVNVYHYAEVNRVTDEGCDRIVNRVLPFIDIDYISYSSYESTIENTTGEHYEDLRESLFSALNKIEKQLKPKPAIKGKRVFIGEYGYPMAVVGSPEEQNRRAINLIRAGLDWGCPFILYWEMYDNETDKEGNRMGYWMIDDKNTKQPIYYTHQNYYTEIRKEIEAYYTENKTLPDSKIFSNIAKEYFDNIE